MNTPDKIEGSSYKAKESNFAESTLLENERKGAVISCNRYHLLQKFQVVCSYFSITFFVFLTAYCVLKEEVSPGSEIFALVLLYILALVLGKLVSFIKLPGLLGMLIAGFLYRNLPFIPFYEDISLLWASTLRSAALVTILLKAGLGLDSDKLRQLKAVVLQLAFSPCLIETLAIAVTSHFFLSLPWPWAIMLGFVISAVSPAVVVPSLLSLQERKFGTDKGVPTLVIAAASVDDILAITGFTIMLSISLTEGGWVWSLIKGFLEPLSGLIVGIVFGVVLWYIPSSETSKSALNIQRSLLLCFGGFGVMFSSKVLDFSGAGPLGCLVLGFVASYKWKSEPEIFSRTEKSISIIWKILEPFLFSLIGCEVTTSSLQSNLAMSILTLAVALIFRIITAFFATFGAGLNFKEKIFVAFAWLPKATVQAAVGPQALDYVLANDKGSEMEDYAKKILTVAVLSILMTAPIGAILISFLGPILLNKEESGSTDLEVIQNENDIDQCKSNLEPSNSESNTKL